MIRKATSADRPRILEVRLAARENQLSATSVSKVESNWGQRVGSEDDKLR